VVVVKEGFVSEIARTSVGRMQDRTRTFISEPFGKAMCCAQS
jgi:hypothetical protein